MSNFELSTSDFEQLHLSARTTLLESGLLDLTEEFQHTSTDSEPEAEGAVSETDESIVASSDYEDDRLVEIEPATSASPTTETIDLATEETGTAADYQLVKSARGGNVCIYRGFPFNSKTVNTKSKTELFKCRSVLFLSFFLQYMI